MASPACDSRGGSPEVQCLRSLPWLNGAPGLPWSCPHPTPLLLGSLQHPGHHEPCSRGSAGSFQGIRRLWQEDLVNGGVWEKGRIFQVLFSGARCHLVLLRLSSAVTLCSSSWRQSFRRLDCPAGLLGAEALWGNLSALLRFSR